MDTRGHNSNNPFRLGGLDEAFIEPQRIFDTEESSRSKLDELERLALEALDDL